MNVFTIRDIENISGIKAHTLRIWEHRYDLISPKRKASNHRLYDNDDLKYILRITYLYNHGYKISRIAALSEEEIKKLALQVKEESCHADIFINQLVEASIDFDQDRFDKILHALVLRFGFEKSVTQVLFPMLKKIGLLWLTGNVIPAQEHFASSLITKKMMMAIDGIERPVSKPGKQRRVLLFTPCGEFHEIPLLFMHYLVKKNGIPYIYLGRNVSIPTLEAVCGSQPVTQLYFHLITNLIRCDVNEYLKKLATLFPDKEIVFSGTCTSLVPDPPENVRLLNDAAAMADFARA